MKKLATSILLILFAFITNANYLFIPMNETQTDHLKAYGIVFWSLERNVPVDWLLNYEGGSFMIKYANPIAEELTIRNVSFNVISDGQANQILEKIAHPESNMDAMKLDVPPKVAVYSPKSKQPPS